ncbi:MAG: single-stranded-DNA-specific exonuclease RecJ [Candidatus Kerfeldbacteria bacterium]|nr:single-stranded-DNA-specific exonuclease RecJ [Candidatus Kerfeldbacteria bacterium]
MLKKDELKWVVGSSAPQEFLDRFPELHPIVAAILYHRGIETQAEVDAYLSPDYARDQHDPYLFKDMKVAVDRIQHAVVEKQKVVVHGDYDADGVCGASVLYTTLKAIGADVSVYLPHRDTEGYGLNMNTVRTLKASGTHLVITVDCGISNAPEVEEAVALGMDVIVTDHHSEPPVLPSAALAILNPKISGETYPYKYLAGVGVAFKLSQALARAYELGEAFEKWLLDLVAISTITDFVPLTGENRVLEKFGLLVLRKNRRIGLREWCASNGIDPTKIDTTTIGFKLGPHINAAGRLEHANMAFEMMVSEDPVKARESAENLKHTNASRQKLSDSMSKDALAQGEQQKGEQVIIAIGKDWPVGLVGLVAGKVASTYQRPTFVISTSEDKIMGSGRSIEQFNLVEAMQSMPEVFEKYGGHPQACGFTIKDQPSLEQFTAHMRERARSILEGADLRKTLKIECELRVSDIDWKLVDMLQSCAPFGEGNPEPVFKISQATVEDFSTIGKKGDHLRLSISHNGITRKCIAFGAGHHSLNLHIGKVIDVAATVQINEWNGNRDIQLELKDIHL